MTMAALAAILLLPVAHATDSKTLAVKVPFSFTAAGTECPAGEYQFTHQKGTIEMKGGEGQIHLSLPVITFIARSPGTSGHLLAFDKVGQGRILSEIWLPGAQGALVNAARGEHEHDVVRLNRKGQR